MLTKSLSLLPALALALGIVIDPAFADPNGGGGGGAGGGGQNSCTGSSCKVDAPRNPLDAREPVKAPIILADPTGDGGGSGGHKTNDPRNPLDPRVSDPHPVAAVMDLGLGAITPPKPKIIKTDGNSCSQC